MRSHLVLAAALLLGASAQTFKMGQLGQKYAWGADAGGRLVTKRMPAATATSTLPVADAACTHGPKNRACWSNGFSVATDFDKKYPTTGRTVNYDFTITNTTCNPDGSAPQQCLLINGQYPGPTVVANWGDTISVKVTNKLSDNGTSIHWHGVRQHNSCGADGVNGITECPIAPGDSFTYTFIASQFGTSWYHSHFSSQYGTGVLGPMLINGPSTANYDEDLGTFMINDWYYAGAWNVEIESLALLGQQQPPPAADNMLVNGTAKNAAGQGQWANVKLVSGKKYLLRLINPSVDNYVKVKLDGHKFTVVSADFIPTNPISNQDWIQLGPGQRHNVVFTANQTSAAYWFRAMVAQDCLSANNRGGRALFVYGNASSAEPADSNEVPPSTGCADLVTTPYWKQSVDKSTYDQQVKDLTVDLTQASGFSTNGQNLVVWALNFTAMNIDWSKPTLQYVFDGNSTFPPSYDVIEIPNEGTWTYWIIQTLQVTQGPTAIAAPPPPHPIHLHGHDFFVLGSGTGKFNGSSTYLNFVNPARRDTATLPSLGWLAIAFNANNPGAWLMHCHIAWHISQGLGVQFLEAKNQIVMPDQGKFNSGCKNWKSYFGGSPYGKYDSGL